jgi:hypothetical protein
MRLRLCAAVLLAAAGAAAEAATLPYRVAVEVSYGTVRGPESLRAELERELRTRLRNEGCFERVDPATSPQAQDLVVSLSIGAVTEESRHETSLVAHTQAEDPEVGRMVVAEISAELTLVIRSAGERVAVRSRSWTQQTSWRPVISEDPREEARLHWIQAAARRGVKSACKGSVRSWEKELRKAGIALPAR